MSDERNISLERSTREINRKFNVNDSSYRTGVPIQDSIARRIFATREDIEAQRSILLSNDMKKFEKNKEYLKDASDIFNTYANMYDQLKDLYDDIKNLMDPNDLNDSESEIRKNKMLNENEVENIEYYTSKNGYFKDEVLPSIKSEFDENLIEIENNVEESITNDVDIETLRDDIEFRLIENVNYFTNKKKISDDKIEVESCFALRINDESDLPSGFELFFNNNETIQDFKLFLDKIEITEKENDNIYDHSKRYEIKINTLGVHYVSFSYIVNSEDQIYNHIGTYLITDYKFNIDKIITIKDNGGYLYNFIKDKDIPSVTNKNDYQIFELNNERKISLFKIDQNNYNKLSSLTKPTEIFDIIVTNEKGDNVMITTKGKENIINRDPLYNKPLFPFIIKSNPESIGDIRISNVKSVIREKDKNKQVNVYGQKIADETYLKDTLVENDVGIETSIDQTGNFRDDKFITGRIGTTVSRMKFVDSENTGIIEFEGEASSDIIENWENEEFDRIDMDTLILVTDQRGHFVPKPDIENINEEVNGSITCTDKNGNTYTNCKIIRKGDVCLKRTTEDHEYKNITEFEEAAYMIYGSGVNASTNEFFLNLMMFDPIDKEKYYYVSEFKGPNSQLGISGYNCNDLIFVGSKIEYSENKFGYVSSINHKTFNISIFDPDSNTYKNRSFRKYNNRDLYDLLSVNGYENKKIKSINLSKFSLETRFSDGTVEGSIYLDKPINKYTVTFDDNSSVEVDNADIVLTDTELENSQCIYTDWFYNSSTYYNPDSFKLKSDFDLVRRSYFSKKIYTKKDDIINYYDSDNSLRNINDAVALCRYFPETSENRCESYYILKIKNISDIRYVGNNNFISVSVTFDDYDGVEKTEDVNVNSLVFLNKRIPYLVFNESAKAMDYNNFGKVISNNDEFIVIKNAVTSVEDQIYYADPSKITYYDSQSNFAWINTRILSQATPEDIERGYIINETQKGIFYFKTSNSYFHDVISTSDITYIGTGNRISNIHGVNIPPSNAWDGTLAADGYVFTVTELVDAVKDESGKLQVTIKNIGSDGTTQTRTVPASHLIINKNEVKYRKNGSTYRYSGTITSTDKTVTFGDVTLRKATNTTKYSVSSTGIAWIYFGDNSYPNKIIASEIIGAYIDNETGDGRISYRFNNTNYFDSPITRDNIVNKNNIAFCVDKDSNKVVPVYNISNFVRESDRLIKIVDSDNVGHTNYNMVMIGDPVLELTPRYKFNQFMFESLILTSVTSSGVSGVWYDSYQKKNTTESNSNIPLNKIAMPYDGKEFFTSDTEKSTITSIDKNNNIVHFANGASYNNDVFANEDMIKYLYVGNKTVKEVTKTGWNKFTVKFTDGTTSTGVDRTEILFDEAKALDFDYILTDPTPDNLTTSKKCSDRTLCRDEITSYQFSYFADRIKINSESFDCIWTNENARWVDRDRIYKVEELIGEPFYSDVNDTTVACKEYTNCVNEIAAASGSVDRSETNDIIIISYIDRNSYSDRYTYELSYYLLYENKFAIVLDGNNTKRKTITKEAYSTNGSKYIKCNGYGFESSLSLNNIDKSNSFSSMSYLFDNTITHKIIDYEELQSVCYTNGYYVASFYDSRANKYYHNAKIKSFTSLKKYPTIKAFRDGGSDNVNSYNYSHSFNKVVLPYYNESYENVELIQSGEGWDDMHLIYVPNADYKRNNSYTEFAIIVPSSDSRILKLDNLKPSYSPTGSLVGYTGTNPIYIYETGSEICAIQPGTNSADLYLKDCNVQLCTATIGAYQMPCKITFRGTDYPLYNAGPIKNSVKNILPISTAYRYINQWRLAENSEVLKEKGNEYVLKTVMSTGVSGPVTNESAWGTFTYDIGYYGLYAQFASTTIPSA